MRHKIVTLTFFGLFVIFALVFSHSASAVDVNAFCSTPAGSVTAACKDYSGGQAAPVDPVVSAIKLAVNILAVIIGVAAVIGIIIAGFRMATANGDANTIASARKALIYSLVGLAVAALAESITLIVIWKAG
jgi:hypothetical protein